VLSLNSFSGFEKLYACVDWLSASWNVTWLIKFYRYLFAEAIFV